MNLVSILLRLLRQRLLASLLTALSVAAGVALVAAILIIRAETQRTFAQKETGFEVIVGAKGSPLQLVLNSMYQIGTPVGNIPYTVFDSVQADPRVVFALPMVSGDNIRGYRVVGTNTDFFSKFNYRKEQGVRIAQGLPFRGDYEAVAGWEAAERAGLQVGDVVTIVHGVHDDETHAHEHGNLRIVGILEPTLTAIDRAVYTSLETVWDVHYHEYLEQQAAAEAAYAELEAAEELNDEELAEDDDPNRSTPGREADHAHSDHDHSGHDHSGHDHSEHDHSGHDHTGHDHSEHDHSEHDHSGHDHSEHDHSGHDHSEHDHSGHDHSEHDHSGHDHSGHDHSEHDHSGHDHSEHDHSVHDHAGHDHSEHDHSEHDHSVHDHAGHDHSEHDHSNHGHAGHDHSGHGHSGHDHLGHGHTELEGTGDGESVIFIEHEIPPLFTGITSIAVSLKSPIFFDSFLRHVNEETAAQAALPIREIQDLFAIVGNINGVLLALSYLVIVIATLAIFVSMYNSLNERKREIAILRSLGARRRTIFVLMVMESMVIAVGGAVCGLVAAHLLLALFSSTISLQVGVNLQFSTMYIFELYLLASVSILAFLVACLPAWKAYRVDVAANLAPIT